MLFTIQFKSKGQPWANDNNYQPSKVRYDLALKINELAKANRDYAFRVHTTKPD